VGQKEWFAEGNSMGVDIQLCRPGSALLLPVGLKLSLFEVN
jgi:hypothetical protein